MDALHSVSSRFRHLRCHLPPWRGRIGGRCCGSVAAQEIARCVPGLGVSPLPGREGLGVDRVPRGRTDGLELAYPPPAPPFQGGGKSLCGPA